MGNRYKIIMGLKNRTLRNMKFKQSDAATSQLINVSTALPQYEMDEIQIVKDNIFDVQNDKTFSFAFMTDTHYHCNYLPVINEIRSLSEISKNIKLDFLALGGDFIENSVKYLSLSYYEDLMYQLKKYLSIPILPIKGNHDDNTAYDQVDAPDSPLLTDKDCIYPNDEYKRVFKYNENINVKLDLDNRNKMYYYFDLFDSKVRCIFLNVIDIPYIKQEDGSLKYKGQWNYGFSNEQLNFISNNALNFDDKCTDQSNWSVIIFSHVTLVSSLIPSDLAINNGDVMLNIIQAFKNKTSYASSSSNGDFAYNINVDFSKNVATDLIACICGHIHNDTVNVIDGITHISTLCARSGVCGSLRHNMVEGTVTENAFDIFTIDKTQRKIYITRFGAGSNRTISY